MTTATDYTPWGPPPPYAVRDRSTRSLVPHDTTDIALSHSRRVPQPCTAVHHNPMWFVGVLLDAVATLAGTGGKQLLRFAVVKNNPWYYPLGLVCTACIDPFFDLLAYKFAAQSIIAPMAGMVVVWNIAIAPCTLGEKLTRSRKLGAFLIIAGTACVGVFGNHNEVERSVEEYIELFARPTAVVYYLGFAVWCAVCGYYWRNGSPFVSGFYVGALGGSLAGNMFTTKAAVMMLNCVFTVDMSDPCAPCRANPFTTTIYPYLFISISLTLACVSLWLLAVGLRTFEALYMITVFEVSAGGPLGDRRAGDRRAVYLTGEGGVGWGRRGGGGTRRRGEGGGGDRWPI